MNIDLHCGLCQKEFEISNIHKLRGRKHPIEFEKLFMRSLRFTCNECGLYSVHYMDRDPYKIEEIKLGDKIYRNNGNSEWLEWVDNKFIKSNILERFTNLKCFS